MMRKCAPKIAPVLIAALMFACLAATAFGNESSRVVISELYIDEINGGSEWVELYNPGSQIVSMANWVIDTEADTDADVTLPGGAEIAPHAFYFIGDETSGSWIPDDAAWPAPDYTETLTLNNSDGWARLRCSASGTIVDIVGWGSPTVCESGPAPEPSEGNSLKRKVSADINEDGVYGPAYDTDNNQVNFFIQDTPYPDSSSSALPPVSEPTTVIFLLLGTGLVAAYLRYTGRGPLQQGNT